MRNIGEGGITLGYSCTGDYSFPLIKRSPSAGEGPQGFLTGGNLLVYHIFAWLTRDVRTRIILDEPTAIQPFVEYAQPVRCRPFVIPDFQGESQDIEISDDEQRMWDAAIRRRRRRTFPRASAGLSTPRGHHRARGMRCCFPWDLAWGGRPWRVGLAGPSSSRR
ncbi:hypothetical protein PWT90_04251 [Aphanocladium album]|nr:hypothetical protein PWT90_04251 [Aphanocladium album]